MNRAGAIGAAIGLFAIGIAIDFLLSTIPFEVYVGIAAVILVGFSVRKWLFQAPGGNNKTLPPQSQASDAPRATPAEATETNPSKTLADQIGLDG